MKGLVIMHTIMKANAIDPCIAEYFLGFVKTSCNDYGFLDMNIFNQCKDSIYIAIDTYRETDSYNNIDGIIGCRRINMEQAKIEKLEYYCKPYQIVYSIEFLHYAKLYGSTDILGNYESADKIIGSMISECLADKNDAFAVYRPYCPTGKTPEEHDALIRNGFYVDSYDPVKEQFTYIRKPKLQGM